MFAYALISLLAFGLNIPCGYIREGHPKFSFKWFFWVHASIPALIWARITLETTPAYIPMTIFFAILGQIVGSRYRQSNRSVEDLERLQQIQDFQLPKTVPGPPKDEDISVVLLNMGGPKSIAAVEPFLRLLFEDPLIIRFPLSNLLQKTFANMLIKFRLKATQERYKLIGGKSPIAESSMQQVRALQKELKQRGRNLTVDLCFNYSEPLPKTYLNKVVRRHQRYILPVSLYSHYSASTTGSNMVYLKRQAARDCPQVRFLESFSFHLSDGFIQAFVDRIHESLSPDESPDDFYLLFSAHGVPLYFLDEGDPYPFLVSQSIAKILDRLKRDYAWSISYQSAVGPLQWIKPSTDDALAALARRGVKKIIVVPISFVTDHIETICEIDIEYRKMAENLGFTDFRMSKAIESHPAFISALADCVERSLNTTVETQNFASLHTQRRTNDR